MGNKLPTFTFRTLINNYGLFIKMNLGIDETSIEKDYENYKKMQPNASVRDYMWSLFQKSILKGADYHVFRAMGTFVAQYEGKNGNQYHRIGLIKEYEFSYKIGVVLIVDSRCPHAVKHQGTYPLEHFQDVLPLANDECSRLNCACCIGLKPFRDSNGRLILIED
jgi:hypothetical protein